MIRLYDSDSHSNFNSNSYRLSQLCHHVNGVHPALSCLLLCNCQYTMSQCFEPAMGAEKKIPPPCTIIGIGFDTSIHERMLNAECLQKKQQTNLH